MMSVLPAQRGNRFNGLNWMRENRPVGTMDRGAGTPLWAWPWAFGVSKEMAGTCQC